MNKTKQRSFYADMDLYRDLSLLSVVEGSDKSSLINRAIAEYLEKRRDQIPREAIAS